MATLGASTVLMPATFRLGIKMVFQMPETFFSSELQYQTALSIARSLCTQGLLTEGEFAIVEAHLRQEFAPILGPILLDK